MLSEELRLKTKEKHQQLEVKIITAIKSIHQRNDYASLLQLFTGYFSSLEAIIEQTLSLDMLPDYPLRRKAAALQADLMCMSAPLPAKIGRANLPTIENSLQALGAPSRIYATSDIPLLKQKGQLDHFKLLIFVNAFHLTEKQHAEINSLKSQGRTLLFFYAPGYAGNAGKNSELSLAASQKLLQMPGLVKIDQQHVIGMNWQDTNGSHIFDAKPWTGKEQIDNYGNPIGPVFYLDSQKTEGWKALAKLRLDEKDQADKIAVARCQPHLDLRIGFARLHLLENVEAQILGEKRGGIGQAFVLAHHATQFLGQLLKAQFLCVILEWQCIDGVCLWCHNRTEHDDGKQRGDDAFQGLALHGLSPTNSAMRGLSSCSITRGVNTLMCL